MRSSHHFLEPGGRAPIDDRIPFDRRRIHLLARTIFVWAARDVIAAAARGGVREYGCSAAVNSEDGSASVPLSPCLSLPAQTKPVPKDGRQKQSLGFNLMNPTTAHRIQDLELQKRWTENPQV
jgi:hypothetical protein